MHEMSYIAKMVSLAIDVANENNADRIKSIEVHIGKTSGVMPYYMQKYFPAHFKRVNENEVQAGDVVLYYGHVALATGNGYEIIHNTRPRIKVSKDFRYRQISGIYRIVE